MCSSVCSVPFTIPRRPACESLSSRIVARGLATSCMSSCPVSIPALCVQLTFSDAVCFVASLVYWLHNPCPYSHRISLLILQNYFEVEHTRIYSPALPRSLFHNTSCPLHSTPTFIPLVIRPSAPIGRYCTELLLSVAVNLCFCAHAWP